MFVTAAAGNFPSAGSAGVDSAFARIVWKKIYGVCLAMPSLGSARIVAHRMDSATSEGLKACGGAETERIFYNARI